MHAPDAESLTLSGLPLFPLGTVLFPGGLLPLRIFEVRYLDMIGRCHRHSAPFGVVALQQGSEVQQPQGNTFAPEQFASIGTLATIDSLESPQAGLLVIRCTGTQRFTVTRRERLRHGLWVADVTRVAPDAATGVPPDLQPVADALARVIERLRERGVAPDQMPLLEPYAFDDCGWVANRWTELLSVPVELKQRLMTLDSPLMRLELVSDLLERTGVMK